MGIRRGAHAERSVGEDVGAGPAREKIDGLGYEKLLSGHPHGPLLRFLSFDDLQADPQRLPLLHFIPPLGVSFRHSASAREALSI